jgi:hypothetical protein
MDLGRYADGHWVPPQQLRLKHTIKLFLEIQMLPDRPIVPKLSRFINFAGNKSLKYTEKFLCLNEEELMDHAARRISLHDYGDSYFRQGLTRLIDSIKQDVSLTFLGRLMQRQAIAQCLENRLQFVEFHRKKPDIFKQPLNPPIIVLGLPRSGTTFLHRLLAQDPQNRGLYFWELIRQAPPVNGKDSRRIKAKLEYTTFQRLSVNLDHIHVIRESEYEECIWLMATTFYSGAFYVLAPVFSYILWCMKQDRLKVYEEYIQLLKIFQAATPDRRLTLKAPAHTGSLPEINRLLPEAVLVQTHRHPVDVVNSINSLIYWAHYNVVERIDIKKMAQCHLDMLQYEINRNLLSRKYHGIEVCDILYEELLADPLGVVKKIYHKHGIPLSNMAEAKMKVFIAANPQHKHGAHKYRTDDFGIAEHQITERFEDYMEQFGYRLK